MYIDRGYLFRSWKVTADAQVNYKNYEGTFVIFTQNDALDAASTPAASPIVYGNFTYHIDSDTPSANSCQVNIYTLPAEQIQFVNSNDIVVNTSQEGAKRFNLTSDLKNKIDNSLQLPTDGEFALKFVATLGGAQTARVIAGGPGINISDNGSTINIYASGELSDVVDSDTITTSRTDEGNLQLNVAADLVSDISRSIKEPMAASPSLRLLDIEANSTAQGMRTLVAGDNISIADNGESLTISSTASGGGGGTTLVKQQMYMTNYQINVKSTAAYSSLWELANMSYALGAVSTSNIIEYGVCITFNYDGVEYQLSSSAMPYSSSETIGFSMPVVSPNGLNIGLILELDFQPVNDNYSYIYYRAHGVGLEMQDTMTINLHSIYRLYKQA